MCYLRHLDYLIEIVKRFSFMKMLESVPCRDGTLFTVTFH